MKAWIPIILTVLVLIVGWPYIRSCTSDVAETTKEIGGSAADMAGKAAGAAGDAAGSVVGAAGDAAGSVVGAAEDAAGSVVGAAEDAAGSVVKGAGDAVGSVAGAAGDAVGAAGNVAGGAADAVAGAAGKLLQGATNAVKKGADFFKFEPGTAASDFANFLSSGSGEAKTFVLDEVVFETGGATLASKSKAQLDRIAKIVSAYDGMTFELQGYTDNTGNADANVALSQKRAESVMQYLVTKNISVGKMVAKGYGAENPRASNNTSEGRAQNRRTEIRAVKN